MPRAKKATTKTKTTAKKTNVEAVELNSVVTADVKEATFIPNPDLSTEVFRISDRLLAFMDGSSNSMGASCNTHLVGDSLPAICKSYAWGTIVSSKQGAPSWELTELRPRGSKVNSGGDTCGAVGFGAVYDSIIGAMRRDVKKNSAGIIWLDWSHKDIQEFLSADFKYVFRGVYLPAVSDNDGRERLLSDKKLCEALTNAYNENRIFLCKRPENDRYTNERLMLNLCTEIEIPHQGFCILGAIQLGRFNLDNLDTLKDVFTSASADMLQHMDKVLSANKTDSYLYCSSPANRQFGLGVSGLASLLANCGVKYTAFADALSEITANYKMGIAKVAFDAESIAHKSTAHTIVAAIARAYANSTSILKGKVSRAFCVQPSATGAYKCADVQGYHTSPELQPVTGIRDNFGVHTIRQSALYGNEKIVFHPDVETVNEVPYVVYNELCAGWQALMNATELAHRHSSCWYGDKFSTEDLTAFVNNDLRLNLYYRLRPYNEVALNKSQVGEGVDTEEFDVDSMINASCGIQQKGAVDCNCAD